jgi:toxin-antitoxin system PIN domain toxin
MRPSDPGAAVLLDANLLLWSIHSGFDRHREARAWLRGCLSETPSVAIPWPTTLAFLRISSHPRILPQPLAVTAAWKIVRGWLDRPNVFVPSPGPKHATIFGGLLEHGQATGNHTSDAHLAALAVEWGLELLSADRDFARYPGLRWRDPLP